MTAARRPAAAAGVLLLAILGSACFGFVLGSCQMLGRGTRETVSIAKRDVPAPDGPDIYRVAGIKGEPDIRIRVAAAVPAAVFDGAREFWIGPAGDRNAAALLRAPVHITLTSREWIAQDATKAQRSWPRRRDLDVTPVADGGDGAARATVNGVAYAGVFRLVAGAPPAPATVAASSPRSGSGAATAVLGAMQPAGASAAEPPSAAEAPVPFDVIEHVPLEEYLPGVLAEEMPHSWSLNAFKVQAIAARSYAIHQKLRAVASGRPFDVEATTQDQAYSGAKTVPVALEAVAQTRGQVLEFGGAVLRAYYSSTCGGRAASARDTWPIDRGYEFNLAAPIQGHDRPFACQNSSLFRWTVERPKAELVRRIATYGEKNGYLIRRLKDLARIEVLRTNETGRPAEYKIIEPGGKWYPLKAEELRLACNTDYPGAPPITRQTRVNSSDLEFEVRGSTVVISGRGFGHGVGMCQYCAQAMGSKGADPIALLELFYPGARVVRAY